MVKVLKPQDFWGEYAIWGATGFDRAGHIFFGMTSNDDRGSGSAHLFEFDPATERFTDRGNVVSELERLGLRRPGETQMKIHSRIVTAVDGYQYFASMDESGENDDGSKLPTWGGHLWRRGPSGTWEHLKATPEALIAVATGGPYVYALGYFNHVLYQFDTRTKRIRSVTVGAVGGHVSRNFFVDERGHAFVSRIAAGAAGAADGGTGRIRHRTEGSRQPGRSTSTSRVALGDSHGIVATTPDGDGGWYFTTGKGRLYRETPESAGSFKLSDLGWIHPAGSRYPASMFRNEQTGTVYAVAMPSHNGGRTFEWIRRLSDGKTTVAPFPYGDVRDFPGDTLVYGSMTRDAAGTLLRRWNHGLQTGDSAGHGGQLRPPTTGPMCGCEARVCTATRVCCCERAPAYNRLARRDGRHKENRGRHSAACGAASGLLASISKADLRLGP